MAEDTQEERTEKSKIRPKPSPLDIEPIVPREGDNIWGWKFSKISLAFLLLIILLVMYRYYQLGIPFSFENLQPLK